MGGDMAQARIFLSHSSHDRAFAGALARTLRQAGADVWHANHNLNTRRLVDDIQREVHDRPIFVVVLSTAAFASRWVHYECRGAWN
jgi:hypothetical protein